jgi:hypothetical protein
MKIRWFDVCVREGGEWVLKSVQETAGAAEKARQFFLQQGHAPEDVKVEQEPDVRPAHARKA